jgi:tripartite-type tricarboxylate transporter receptor subunit TctC
MMVVSPNTLANTVKELTALGKTVPAGKMAFGHLGQGSTSHLAGELFGVLSGIKLTAVPSDKGVAANILATMQGAVQIAPPRVLAALSQVKSAKLRRSGVTGAKRTQAAPDVPTIQRGAWSYNAGVTRVACT